MQYPREPAAERFASEPRLMSRSLGQDSPVHRLVAATTPQAIRLSVIVSQVVARFQAEDSLRPLLFISRFIDKGSRPL